jgi:Vinculin family
LLNGKNIFAATPKNYLHMGIFRIIFVNANIILCMIWQERIVIDPLAYNEVRTRPSLEERLESIISGAALMADSSCTRDERRERIVAECNAVRQALQDLLSEYMSNVSIVPFLFVTYFSGVKFMTQKTEWCCEEITDIYL